MKILLFLILIVNIVIFYITILNIYDSNCKSSSNPNNPNPNTNPNPNPNTNPNTNPDSNPKSNHANKIGINNGTYRGYMNQDQVSNCAKCQIQDSSMCKNLDCSFTCKQDDPYCFCMFGCFDKNGDKQFALFNDCSSSQKSTFNPDEFCKQIDDSFTAQPL